MSFNVLCACEESQAVCLAFRQRGFSAFSCDILDCSGGAPQWHVKGDCLALFKPPVSFITLDGCVHFVDHWDLIVAHPPCTYLTNAAARHLWKGHQLNKERYEKGLDAKAFFMSCLNADCSYIAVENPVPSLVFELPKYTQIIQPYEFGHPYSKRTCLWLKGLPQLKPSNIIEPVATFCPSGSYSHKHGEKHRGMFTTDRAKQRSKTFSGIALAMAAQWGDFLISEKEGG